MSYIRRGLQMLILFFLITFTIAGSNTTAWIHWSVLVIFFAVLLIADFMFMNDGFTFDPFYTSYAKVNDPNY